MRRIGLTTALYVSLSCCTQRLEVTAPLFVFQANDLLWARDDACVKILCQTAADGSIGVWAAVVDTLKGAGLLAEVQIDKPDRPAALTFLSLPITCCSCFLYTFHLCSI